jgi:hypothetical protein
MQALELCPPMLVFRASGRITADMQNLLELWLHKGMHVLVSIY